LAAAASCSSLGRDTSRARIAPDNVIFIFTVSCRTSTPASPGYLWVCHRNGPTLGRRTGPPPVWQTVPVRVYLGSDHAGLELKTALIGWLREAGHEAVDCGPVGYDPQDDYPVYVLRAAQGAVGDPGSLGIVIGGSGNGEQIAANKVPGVRAALAWTTETAQLARQHNDANVLSLGARMYSLGDAIGFAKVFVETPFSGDARHARRLAEIADYEKTAELPPLPHS
jgi:ribose 5-phosphate isomerase B